MGAGATCSQHTQPKISGPRKSLGTAKKWGWAAADAPRGKSVFSLRGGKKQQKRGPGGVGGWACSGATAPGRAGIAAGEQCLVEQASLSGGHS